MIKITIDDRAVKAALAAYPKIAARSIETAIDKIAMAIKDAEVAEMKRVFDRPTPFTLNSLKVTRTKGHNMMATVWFKEPDRMEDHYLVPQVEGTERKLKGFELAIWRTKFVPGKGVKLNQHGNVSRGLLVQIKSVLGRAELTLGYQANLTAKSAKRNIKQRDYVYLPRGSRGGALPPGVYQRVSDKFKGLNSAKFRRSQAKFGTYQKGKTVGRFSSIIRARGLRPILIVGKQHAKVTPLLKFYEVARRVNSESFAKHFHADFARRLPR